LNSCQEKKPSLQDYSLSLLREKGGQLLGLTPLAAWHINCLIFSGDSRRALDFNAQTISRRGAIHRALRSATGTLVP
jgi:hypothetical protein